MSSLLFCIVVSGFLSGTHFVAKDRARSKIRTGTTISNLLYYLHESAFLVQSLPDSPKLAPEKVEAPQRETHFDRERYEELKSKQKNSRLTLNELIELMTMESQRYFFSSFWESASQPDQRTSNNLCFSFSGAVYQFGGSCSKEQSSTENKEAPQESSQNPLSVTQKEIISQFLSRSQVSRSGLSESDAFSPANAQAEPVRSAMIRPVWGDRIYIADSSVTPDQIPRSVWRIVMGVPDISMLQFASELKKSRPRVRIQKLNLAESTKEEDELEYLVFHNFDSILDDCHFFRLPILIVFRDSGYAATLLVNWLLNRAGLSWTQAIDVVRKNTPSLFIKPEFLHQLIENHVATQRQIHPRAYPSYERCSLFVQIRLNLPAPRAPSINPLSVLGVSFREPEEFEVLDAEKCL